MFKNGIKGHTNGQYVKQYNPAFYNDIYTTFLKPVDERFTLNEMVTYVLYSF